MCGYYPIACIFISPNIALLRFGNKTEKKTLVSHDGSPIGAVENFTDYENLPVITGEAAPKSFTLLQSVLESYPELQNALRGAKMSRAARWTIYLENGTLVHLPIHNIDEAFIRLRWLDKQFQVLSFQSSVIDLRVRDRAAIGERTIPVAVQNKTDDTAQRIIVIASLTKVFRGKNGTSHRYSK